LGKINLMKIIKNKFKNLLIIEGQLHGDKRGYLREVYLEKVIKKKFKFQIISKSKTFGQYYSLILSKKNCKSIYIPEGFAHGFIALEKENIISYNCTNYRNAKSELTLKWNDSDINIKWPKIKPILSNKDNNGLSLNDFIKKVNNF